MAGGNSRRVGICSGRDFAAGDKIARRVCDSPDDDTERRVYTEKRPPSRVASPQAMSGRITSFRRDLALGAARQKKKRRENVAMATSANDVTDGK